jgi:hypothetical protein
MKNCDPDKNYINSNPEAIENYKELVRKGEVKSYYLKITPSKLCEYNKCFSYNPKIYNFMEVYFNDADRQGVYTIKIINDPNDKNCIKKPYSYDKNCYLVTKNKNDEIKSRFYVELDFDNDVTYKKFMDLKNNNILFESSFQIYKTPSIAGEPSGGFCPIKNNHNDYQFNILAYPE